MRFILLIAAFFFSVITGNAQTPVRVFKLDAGITSRDYIPGIVIVKFKPASINKQATQSTIPTITCSIKGVKIESVVKKFNSPAVTVPSTLATSANTQPAADPIGLDRIYEVKFSGTANIVDVINDFLKNDQVEYAEPSYIYRSNYVPNDPLITNQNYLTQVKAQQAWDITRNSSGIIIGIIDSGSDLDHPDLAANIYINTADPIDGIDNDGDGYVDNNRGWDLVGLSGSSPKQDNDPNVTSDTTSHGVHVSGLASAVTNNGVGIASIAFNAKLLIIKAGADNDGSSIYKGYEGIKYAADHGAKIISCSWGGYNSSSLGLDIVNYAISKDCLIIAAAGNENTSNFSYPASYTGVISVASVDGSDRRSSFSNYGSRVSLSAPGTSIYSTFFNNVYASLSGTSMATPIVASAAALVKSYYPSYTMAQVGKLLIASADGINAQNPNFVNLLGSGRLNVYRAISQDFSQTITFPAIAAKTFGDADFDPGATASSGLTVTYSSSNPAVATIVNNRVHIVGAGTSIITASQAGNTSFSAAASVSQTLTVNKAAQSIAFSLIPVQIRGAAAYALQVSASSGLTVTLSVSDPFVASVSGKNLISLRVGKASVTASQAGNENYLAATPVTQNLQVTDVDGSLVKIFPAVSPNGDGINDVLTIEGIKDYTNNHVSVFTATGATVFEVNNYNNSDHVFTGRSKSGDTLPQGTYFYLLQFSPNGAQQRKAGYFVLKY